MEVINKENDLISRRAAINTTWEEPHYTDPLNVLTEVRDRIKALPSAQQTLCGYNIEHLILIANMLKKENLPPERITEALTDIGRIVSIIRNELEETLRKDINLVVGNVMK